MKFSIINFRFSISFLFFVFNFLFSFSQTEKCDNCIDDDGDGLIDCYDPDCRANGACGNSFIVNNADTSVCKGIPSSSVFSMKKLWTSVDAVDNRNTTVTGDIDGDGFPEVISFNSQAPGQLYIIDGRTGLTKDTVKSNPQMFATNDGAAIADVDKDGKGEIFIVSTITPGKLGGGALHCYNYNGTSKWTADSTLPLSNYRPNIADFDGDGKPQVYIANMIFDALTGKLIVKMKSSLFNETGQLITKGDGSLGAPSTNQADAFSMAADVLPHGWINPSTGIACTDCDGLELVCGNEVYSVSIINKTLTLRSTAPAGFNDGYTSIADFNGDGELDVIDKMENCTVGVWDPRTQTQIGAFFEGIGSANGSGGQANVGNFDADPQLEIALGENFIFLSSIMT